MQRRKSGRPSGTDGSDFSYRMVVDSRYIKVAKGKSRLHALIITQVITQVIGLVLIFLSTSKEQSSNTLAISSSVFGLISLVIGELGRRCSRVSFLRVYIITSCMTILLSLYSAVSSNSALKVILNIGDSMEKKFQLVETLLLIIRSLVQLLTISTVISLIGNMSPPKKTS